MPTERTVVARGQNGSGFFYNQSTIPSPQVVSAYEQFYKGAAKIMLDMAVAEQKNETTIRDRYSRLEFVARILGMCFGFILTALFIVCGTYLLATEHYITGSASVIVALISLIGTITMGGRQPRQRQTPSSVR